jgi:cobalamin biosynthesis protein CobD/CbiB
MTALLVVVGLFAAAVLLLMTSFVSSSLLTVIAAIRLAANPALALFLTYFLPSLQVLIAAVNSVIGTSKKQNKPPTTCIMQFNAIWL